MILEQMELDYGIAWFLSNKLFPLVYMGIGLQKGADELEGTPANQTRAG